MKPTHTKGFFGSVLLLIPLLCLLTACRGESYRNDLSSAAVMDEILDELDAEDDYRPVGDSFVSASSFGEDYATFLSLLTDHRIVVAINADSNVNEMGVFHVSDPAHVAAAEAVVQDYVAAQQVRLPDYLSMYNPAEIPKVENAAVRVCGQYILYTVLDSQETREAHDAFHDALTDR